jgi:hypothetical protein
MSDIKRVFFNVSMGKRHDGLAQVAEDAGVKLKDMEPGDYLIFVNAARDKVALLVGKQDKSVIQPMAYYRLGKGQTIDLNVIKYLPRHFNGRTLNYDAAMREALDDVLKRKANRPTVIMV